MKASYLCILFTIFFIFFSCDDKTSLPELSTLAVSEITPTTAKGGGNILSDGGESIAACGVCWSVDHLPTVSDNKTSDDNEGGSFTSSLSGLTPETEYYVRAYAKNSAGTGYGNEVSFITGQECSLICNIGTETFSIDITCETGGYSTTFNNETTNYQYDNYGRMSGITKNLNRTRTYLNTNNTYTITGVIEVNLAQSTETHNIAVSGGKFALPKTCN